MLNIIRIENIFNSDQMIWTSPAGELISSYLPGNFDLQNGYVELNGLRIKHFDIIARNNDTLILIDVPYEGVAIVVGIIVALASLAFSIYSVVSAPSVPALLEPEEEIEQNIFTGVQTTVGPGRPIPFVFGEVRVGGHILESFSAPEYDILPDSTTTVVTIDKDERTMPTSRALNTMIGLCWGPIESITSIEIDDNPIENISGIQYEKSLGTNIERPLSQFEGSRTDIAVGSGTISVSGGAYTEQTTIDVDSVAVKIEFTQGLYSYDNGVFEARDVDIIFKYKKESAGGYTTYGTFTASGASRTNMEFWVLFPEFADRDTYDIQVERSTADNSDPDIQDEFQWATTTQILNGTYAHPGIAKIGFRQIPQERQSVPRQYTALVKGCNDIRIYSSSTVYSTAWTDNPAWLALYWITHSKFGLGQFYSYSDVEDMQDWIDAATWCSDMVSNGQGGFEKRAVFNYEFTQSRSAFDILRMFYNSCGLFIIEEAGRWRVIVDDDDPIVQNFSEGNYVKDSCTYSWIDIDERATRLTGKFRSEDHDYDSDLFALSDITVEPDNHYIEKSVNVEGATNPNQVARRLFYTLQKSRLNNKSVVITVGEAGRYLRAGDVFGLSTLTGGIGIGNGRIVRALTGGQTFYLDSELALNSTKTYELTVCHVETKTIETVTFTVPVSETTDILDLRGRGVWAEDVIVGDGYSVGEVGYASEKFRCIRTKFNEDMTRYIEATKYDPDVYDLSSFATEADPGAYKHFNIDLTPSAVGSIDASQRSTIAVIDLSWSVTDEDDIINHFEVWFKHNTTACWLFGGTTVYTSFSVHNDLVTGLTYDLAVIAVSPRGRKVSLDNATSASVTLS